MEFEAAIVALLNPLVANEVYWDTTPDNYQGQQCIILSMPGGRANQYVDKTERPSHRHTRLRVSLWGPRRDTVNALARQIEDTLVASNFTVQIMGGAIGDYSEAMKLYGSNQDFGVWFPNP